MGRWALTVLLIGLAAAITDYALPNLKRPWRWVTPGSVFVILAWLLASKGFNAYVHYVGSYSKTYGALGGLMILMLWIYIVSLIILVGAEVNNQLDKIRSESWPPSPSRLSIHQEAQTTAEGELMTLGFDLRSRFRLRRRAWIRLGLSPGRRMLQPGPSGGFR